MLRVTADTNILISGLAFRTGKPFELLELARLEQVDLNVSEAILDEMCGVLRRKFKWPVDNVAKARKRIEAIAGSVLPSVTIDVIKEDPSDNRILECAVSAGSDYIVTGDKHLLRVEQFGAIRILRVAEFLDLFERETTHQR